MFNLSGLDGDNEGHDEQPAEPHPPLQAAVEAEAVDTVRGLASTADAADLTAALCRSCQQGKTAVVQALLESGRCDLNATVSGDTPLFLAARKLEPAIVNLLLQHGADVTVNSLNISRSPAAGDKAPMSTPLHGVVDNLRRYQGKTDVSSLEEIMGMLLDAGCDINAQDFRGETVLLSCLHQEVAVVQFLLQRGADPNIVNGRGNNAMSFLHKPLQYPEWFKALMKHGARLDIGGDSETGTALHSFASHSQLGDLSLFKPYVSDWKLVDAKGNTLLHIAANVHLCGSATITELLKLGLDVNHRNYEGRQPIHMIDRPGEDLRDALEILCAAGGDLEARDRHGRTLLTRSMCGHPMFNPHESIPVLVSCGANINAQDYSGNGILSNLINPYTFRSEHVDLLLAHGADPQMKNYQGDTFLHQMAAQFPAQDSDTAILTMIKLLKMGVSPTHQNYKGQTPLHVLCSHVSDHFFAAAAEGDKYAIDLLLDAGLHHALNISDYQGIRPIHLAASVSEILVGKLIAYGADTTATTKDGRNLLHIAATARQSNIIGLLLDHYASNNLTSLVNAQSSDGQTPLHLACRSGRLETVTLLLAHGATVKIKNKAKKTPLDACAESLAEDQLWQKADDQGNMFHTLSAAGILAEDHERPKMPTNKNQKRENHKRVGWKGEIISESATLGVGRIVRLLARFGALVPMDTNGLKPMFHAVSADHEEMVVELDRASKAMGIELARTPSLGAQRCLIRSQHLPALFKERFKSHIFDKDALEMIILGHDHELAHALEENADGIEDKSCLHPILILLARWGYPEPFERIGRLMSDSEWINKSGRQMLGSEMSPSLLAAAQRELPNLEVIKVIIEQFHGDVNVQYQEGMRSTPRVYYQSKMAHQRQFKPGDTALHYLAQGEHWWHEKAIVYLLEHGADPNARDAQGKTPLCRAVLKGELAGHRQREIARILLDGGADPNIAATCGFTALAMSTHDPQLFKLLVDHGAYPSEDHPMELYSALYNFQADTVTALLGMDLDANTITLSDAQPHWHTHRVKKVPQNNGLILRPLRYISMLPFNECNSREHSIRMVRLLLEHGADPFLNNDDTSLILHEIFADGGVIQPWLELPDLNLERRDPRGQTLLLSAAKCEFGTNSYGCKMPLFPFRGGRIERSPWQEGDPTRAMTLYERGANLTAVDHQGNNVLHKLAGRWNKEKFAQEEFRRTLALFVKRAPELINQTNSDGQTPLTIAENCENEWAAEILRTEGATEE
ncbi:uncharacterized protein N7482_005029 [Penicillium canariense]|uniref:Uncharacterized protein n=1 Tax=Penicillium canariense TaxID=189055 RepID=A0A9W9I3S3_9EURO|nr:uncharacterized protein N7482_005029 [Penicillium canariense]KAJ5166248.1 hypothetical protein N7482_005029 [Penicillium canariense]